jgi:bidirectional [NiFe] hydrogenase diaphorase subunit
MDQPQLKELFLKDPRYKAVFTVMAKHKRRPDALIEILHKVESVFSYVPLDVMRWLSVEMSIPPSRIYGVVTFYHFFSLKPKGEHSCVICTGTACHVKGAAGLLNQIEHHLKLRPGETSADGKLTVSTARCVGCCGLAPVAVIDGHLEANATPDDIVGKIRKAIA